MPSYDSDVVTDLIAEWIDSAGRGAQSKLARTLGVRPQTVNKWYLRQTCPEPERWAEIETFFGQPDGTITRAAGPVGWTPAPAGLEDRVSRLEEGLAEVRRLVELLGTHQGDDAGDGSPHRAATQPR